MARKPSGSHFKPEEPSLEEAWICQGGMSGYNPRDSDRTPPAGYSSDSRCLALARSSRCSSVTSGYFRSSDRIAVVTTSATTARVTHLWSAGTTYHGAHSVLVADRQSAYARMYRPQEARSSRSAGEN